MAEKQDEQPPMLPLLTIALNEDGSVDRSRSTSFPPVSADAAAADIICKDRSLNEQGLWLRIFRPAAAAATTASSKPPVIVYCHGGGFIIFTSDSLGYHALCEAMARRLNAIVVSVNFRAAPEHRLPAAYEDVLEALAWLQERCSSSSEELLQGADLERVFIVGDSAGGNISHHVVQRWCSSSSSSSLKLAGQVLIEPFFGAEARSDSEVEYKDGPVLTLEVCDLLWKLSLPVGANREHPFCNVAGELPVLTTTLKSMVVVGGMDPLKDRGSEYAKLTGSRLVEHASAPHGFYFVSDSSETKLLLEEIAAFVEET